MKRISDNAEKQGVEAIATHQREVKACRRCPQMIPPVVIGKPVNSRVYLIGQAPGDKEGPAGKPFAWTAGKTLFKWFSSIGVDEDIFRSTVYMAAVCRCFPGKNPKGGDRVPTKMEIASCSEWMEAEYRLLQPRLLIPVGKLAIAQLMPVSKLVDVIGRVHRLDLPYGQADVVPLPHPSGASTWHRTDPGKQLLKEALDLIASHPEWRNIKG